MDSLFRAFYPGRTDILRICIALPKMHILGTQLPTDLAWLKCAISPLAGGGLGILPRLIQTGNKAGHWSKKREWMLDGEKLQVLTTHINPSRSRACLINMHSQNLNCAWPVLCKSAVTAWGGLVEPCTVITLHCLLLFPPVITLLRITGQILLSRIMKWYSPRLN